MLINFVQGSLWKSKVQLYPGKILIPYFIYIDDFELNNPLGTHTKVHSICGIYYSFPSLPNVNSKLENTSYRLKKDIIQQFPTEKIVST